jgi:hypothetical protein
MIVINDRTYGYEIGEVIDKRKTMYFIRSSKVLILA